MVGSFEYELERDFGKAAVNQRKHAVSFEMAATVLLDPLAQTMLDPVHSDFEERWVSVGRARDGRLILVIYTWEDLSPIPPGSGSFPHAQRPGAKRRSMRKAYE